MFIRITKRMKLIIAILHAGNEVIFESLETIKKNVTIPHSILIWYHPVNDSVKVDITHFQKLLTYTDDVIMCTKNKKCPAAIGFMEVYSEYDYMIVLNDDMSLKPMSVEKMLGCFSNLNKVALVGEGSESHKQPATYEVNNTMNFPDWGGMISREAINDLGSHGAFFPTYGFDFMEWGVRAINRGYKVVNYQGLINHGGKFNRSHESSHLTDDFKNVQGESMGKLRICQNLYYKNYNWWSSKI